ncbi:hypothetical protein ACRALDRAFT_1062622 [Sodiomyces alcalophilus JCM 7366]|uniref:uncharacterized protein n=1 Tax=Sodiomyces alcalophilus JCM 7366 TaxID=591952 RepID=UPI0039B3E80E
MVGWIGWSNGLLMGAMLLFFAAALRRVLALPAALDPGKQAVKDAHVRVWLVSLRILTGSLRAALFLDIPVHGCWARRDAETRGCLQCL